MNPARKCRLALAMTALASYGACGDEMPPEAAYVPPVAHEVPHRDLRRPDVADVTVGLERTVATAPRVSRSRPRPAPPERRSPPAGDGDRRVVSSTAYCLTGVMANGQRVFRGAVAMNGVPLGSRWRVVETGEVFVVADRIGHGSGFDIAMPGDCDGARRYGRRTITVERVQ